MVQRGQKDVFCRTLGNNHTEVVLQVVIELYSLPGSGQKWTTCLPLGTSQGNLPEEGCVCSHEVAVLHSSRWRVAGWNKRADPHLPGCEVQRHGPLGPCTVYKQEWERTVCIALWGGWGKTLLLKIISVAFSCFNRGEKSNPGHSAPGSSAAPSHHHFFFLDFVT